MIAISGCLLGQRCRYDGGSKPDDAIITMAGDQDYIAVCPEALGGLQSPRLPAEIVGGNGFDVLKGKARVIARDGHDVTEEFINGAGAVLALCKEKGVETVYLKEKSPSCGVKTIYDGSFGGMLQEGPGVCAALLIKNGVKVVSVG